MKTKKKVVLAGILSFLMAGLGHFYLGLWKRGLAWLLGAIAIGLALALLLPNTKLTAVGVIIGLLSALDAKKQAEKLNASLGSETNALKT